MKQMTEAKLKELLDRAYEAGFRDSERGLCDDDREYQEVKAKAVKQIADSI